MPLSIEEQNKIMKDALGNIAALFQSDWSNLSPVWHKNRLYQIETIARITIARTNRDHKELSAATKGRAYMPGMTAVLKSEEY